MFIQTAEYIGSFPKFSALPKPTLAEYCFWGRSNVGKSSVINYLCNRKDLALTSSTPGKTINLNFFHINNNFYIVDLPGYGYAQVSRSIRNAWNAEIEQYLKKRESLLSVFILVDISIPAQESDLEKISWMGENEIPFVILFTKSDKCRKIELKMQIEKFQNRLLQDWNELPQMILTSAHSRLGREEVLMYISEHLKAYESHH